MSGTVDEAVVVIEGVIREQGLQAEGLASNVFAIALPGEKRLKTACLLTVGRQAVEIEAFVMRAPEENREGVYAYLLRRNARMYAVAWSIDDNGDVYLRGRLPLAAVSPDEIDRVLGAVLEYSDSMFNTLLELGFAGSIRREWAWRVKNNESLANLAAFAEFAQREPDAGRPAG